MHRLNTKNPVNLTMYSKDVLNALNEIFDFEVYDIFIDYNSIYIDFFTDVMTDYFIDYSDLDEYINYNIVNAMTCHELLYLIKEYLISEGFCINLYSESNTTILEISKEIDGSMYNYKEVKDNSNSSFTELEMFLEFMKALNKFNQKRS